jgi:Helix-loop-helix DNA-binding domain
MQHLFEKKRRRRESHNLVERRRRDNINDRIQVKKDILFLFFIFTPGIDSSTSQLSTFATFSVF